MIAPPATTPTFFFFLESIAPTLYAIGWLTVIILTLWTIWKIYLLLTMIVYISGIEWTFLQITLPEDTEETPKNMETVYEVLGGIHKNPDLNEKYFEGYLEPWYSCEMQCTQDKVRYILVVPTPHRKLFESVIYGQYPSANIEEVEDYTLRYDWKDIRKTFELFGTELVLVKDDVYPIRTYMEYETPLAEEIRFVDPHQILIESLTNIEPGEEFWVQVLVRPIDAGDIDTWSKKGEKEVDRIAERKKDEPPPGVIPQLFGFLMALPGDLYQAFMKGPVEMEEEEEEDKRFSQFPPSEEAKMKGIARKVSQTGFKVKIRVMYIAPIGELKKPNQGSLIGAFKQFNTFNLNSFKPDPLTKTNGPKFIMMQARRRLRERSVFLNYQWRDFFGRDSGQIMNAEELATIYHFPTKYIYSPSVQRAKSGIKTPPEHLPYV